MKSHVGDQKTRSTDLVSRVSFLRSWLTLQVKCVKKTYMYIYVCIEIAQL